MRRFLRALVNNRRVYVVVVGVLSFGRVRHIPGYTHGSAPVSEGTRRQSRMKSLLTLLPEQLRGRAEVQQHSDLGGSESTTPVGVLKSPIAAKKQHTRKMQTGWDSRAVEKKSSAYFFGPLPPPW